MGYFNTTAMTAKRAKGFSLIELLIAVTILMLVLGLAMYAYQLYNQRWQKDLSKLEQSFVQYKHLDLFNHAMNGITPYGVKQQQNFGFYFLGRTNGFTAITQNPLVETEAAAVIRVFKEQLADGSFQLVYEEASLAKLLLVDAEQELPFNHRIILLGHLTALDFEYQRQSIVVNEMFPELNTEKIEWVKELDGLVTKAHPSYIRIFINGFVWEFRIANREKTLLNRSSLNLEDAV